MPLHRRPSHRLAARPRRQDARALRSPVDEDETRRRVSEGGNEWAGPSRRARLLAAGLAVALAAITFAVVSYEWRKAAPPPAPRPTSVEARLIATPATAPAPSPTSR